MSKFRVRFVGDDKRPSHLEENVFQRPQMLDYPNRRRKSRYACLECKDRHLKCDETFPVCLRCKQRGVACRSAFRSARWQLEVPGLTIESRLSTISSDANHRLIQYWVEKASQIMVIDPNINPFSFGILKYFETSQSLIYAVQSLSVAHEHFFSPASLEKVWEEQGQALKLVQKELGEKDRLCHGSLLTVLLIGLCSAWAYHKEGDESGQQHLHGARAILDILLAEPGSEEDPFVQQAVAIYLGWDQAVAFLLPPNDQVSLDNENLVRCVKTMRNQYNPTLAYAIEIMYLLGKVGRYCRSIIDGGLRDVETEAYLQEQLLQFEPSGKDSTWDLVNDSLRKHGLIMLYRAIESSSVSIPELSLDGFSLDELPLDEYPLAEFSLAEFSLAEFSLAESCLDELSLDKPYPDGFTLGELSIEGLDLDEASLDKFSLDQLCQDGFSLDEFAQDELYVHDQDPNGDVIKRYSNDIIQNIDNLPDGSRCHGLLSLALLSAASELTDMDSAKKQNVREQFRNLFSLTRLPVNMCALQLLEELWDLDINGHKVFWMLYVVQKSLIFTLC